MKARLLGLVLLAGAVLCARAADDGNVAGREAQLAAAVLVKQNEALRAEVNRLREEVAKMTVALAQAKAELDEAKVAKGGNAAQQNATTVVPDAGGAATVTAESWQITDVNPDLKLVVLDSGRASGLKQGMMVYALRGEKPAARLRVVDVRDRMTGAVIEEILGAGSPEKGDRVVLMSAPK